MKRQFAAGVGAACAAALLFVPFHTVAEETRPVTDEAAFSEEQAVEEIQPLIELSQVKDTEGMGLEELTEAFSETAMSDFSDSYTGFFMQYPAFFVFNDEQEADAAVTEDGTASLRIENMPNEGELTEEALTEALRFETPDAEIVRNEQNGCLRMNRSDGNGKMQTDLYLIAPKSFHHITIIYPADQKDTYERYIQYMINTMESLGADQG